MAKCVTVLTFLAFAVGCGSNPSDKLAKLTEEFVYTTLSFSPSAATSAGLHEYQKQKLDNLLDDFSAPSLERQRKFYEDFQSRLKALPADRLTAEDRARPEVKAVFEKMEQIDRGNLAWLKGVIATKGWPTRSMVGPVAWSSRL